MERLLTFPARQDQEEVTSAIFVENESSANKGNILVSRDRGQSGRRIPNRFVWRQSMENR
jgi:hypothetical protein